MNAPQPSQGCSFLGLPTELLLEIAALFPFLFTIHSPQMRPWQEDRAPERLERRKILRALSQTCVALRIVFLPLLWRHFEATKASLDICYAEGPLPTLIFPYIRCARPS